MSTIPIRDVSLFVKVMGQGYPLLLMHGGPGLDHTSLLPLVPLADQFTLIFYDHRCNGRYDFLFPPEHQAILADRLPNAKLKLVERAGHNPQMEQSAEVLAEIRRFMKRSDPTYAESAQAAGLVSV